MRTRPRHWMAPVALLLLVAACSPAESESTTTTAGTSTTAPTETSTTRSDASVTLETPAQVGAGTDFTVAWTGPDNADDYVTIVETGVEEGASGDWFYTRDGSDGTLVAPTLLGAYEIRYVDGQSDATVHTVTIQVVESAVTLDAPDEVDAGSEFEVAWVGPDGPGDYVTIVPVGSPEGYYESYFDTADANPGTLVAPVEGGAYEIRYVAGVDGVTFHTVTVTVIAQEVTLEAPDAVDAGTDFEVDWTGPDGPKDYITIVLVGSPEGAYLDYEYTSVGTPITLTAPSEPGAYEIRYLSERVSGIFASVPIEVR